jgi:arsenite methyltransferase
MGQMREQKKADYGQDVPDLVRDNFIIAGLLAVMGGFLRVWSRSRESTSNRLVYLLGEATLAVSVFSALDGLGIIWSSRVAKFWIRDRLLDGLRLRGNETILDVGCGHGLLLIGAAMRLPQGKAVGLDLWSQVDQGGNSRAVTLENAEAEGVAGRVELYDGDMRSLPFARSTFDAVVASVSIHNIEDRAGRHQALSEIARVLKPGGQLALMDIFCVEEYADDLRSLGLRDVRMTGRYFLHWPPSRIVTGSK